MPRDYYGNSIYTGYTVKLTTDPKKWEFISYEKYKNKYGFKNGIGIVTDIRWSDEGVAVGHNNTYWDSSYLEIIKKTLYQSILIEI